MTGREELVALAERLNAAAKAWLPSSDLRGEDVVNITFSLGERDLIVSALRAAASPDAVREALESLKRAGDEYYVKYINQIDEHCRGANAKLRSGDFTAKDLDAHTRAYEYLGLHRRLLSAVSEINAALQSRRGDDEPVANKKTYIKPLRTIVEIQACYADQIRDLLNTPVGAAEEIGNETCHDCGYRAPCDQKCPNCNDANEYGDYEGPTCEVCGGVGSLPLRLVIAKQLAKSDREAMPPWEEIQPRVQKQFLRSADDVLAAISNGGSK